MKKRLQKIKCSNDHGKAKISAIMESLHKQYVDSNTELKGNREILELIKLEALGFLSSEEKCY